VVGKENSVLNLEDDRGLADVGVTNHNRFVLWKVVSHRSAPKKPQN
jgi:hypothetical protein